MTNTSRRWRQLAFGALSWLYLPASACNPVEIRQSATTAVKEFHQRLDRAEFDAIYRDTTPDFKMTTRKSDFVALLEATHKRLGNTVFSDEQNWRINKSASRTLIQLEYKTHFAAGDAVESFNYDVNDTRKSVSVKLLGYHINSQLLVAQ